MQVLSDIHLEYYDNYPGLTYFIEPKTNILILAGDICYYKHKHFISSLITLSSSGLSSLGELDM